MRTLDAKALPILSRRARFARDAKLLLRLASMLVSYFSRGALIRARYRRCQRRGGVYWLDEG